MEVSQLDRRKEMSHVMTVRAAVENLMLFSLYKICVGRSCSTSTNHSHEPPLVTNKNDCAMCKFFEEVKSDQNLFHSLNPQSIEQSVRFEYP